MAPKKATDKSGGDKKKRAPLSLEEKREIIAKHERGVRLVDIAKEYGRNPSTIGTVLKQKEAIRGVVAPAKGVTTIAKQRTGEEEVAEIVSITRSLGLDVDDEDMEELIEEHSEDLTTEDLKALAAIQHSAVDEDVLHFDRGQQEEAAGAFLPTAEIKDILRQFHNVSSYVEKHHPEKVFTSHAIAHFDNVCLSHFGNLLKARQKQTSLDQFFTKEGEPSSKKAKGADDP